MSKKGIKGFSHSKGYHKNVIVSDPNAEIKIVDVPILLSGSMRYELKMSWEGKHQCIIKQPITNREKYAAIAYTKLLIDIMRKSDMEKHEAEAGIEDLPEEEFNARIMMYRQCIALLKQMEEFYAAEILNQQKDAPEPIMAIVTKNPKQ